MSDYIDIVFDGPPSHESGRFVEVEKSSGASISFGEWVHRPDGYWALRIVAPVAGSSPAGEVPQRHLTESEHQVMKRALRASSRLVADGDGYTAAAARLRNPSEADVERVRDALEKSMGKPRGTVDMDRHARAALLAAAEMMEGK